MEYFLYYILVGCIILFVRGKKIAIALFLLIWFLLVGLRFETGVDWFSTLAMFERAHQVGEPLAASFYAYNLVDSEVIYKLFSYILDLLSLSKEYNFLLISFFEVILLWIILIRCERVGIAIFCIACVFTINYGFNAMRQGFALLALTAVVISNNSASRFFALFVAFCSHWASLPIVAGDFIMRRLKLTASSITLLVGISIGVIYILQPVFDLVPLRFVNVGQYERSGFGIKLIYLSLLAELMLIKGRPEFFKLQMIVVLMLFLAAVFYPVSLRFFLFYIYFLVMVTAIHPPKPKPALASLCLLAVSICIFEWQEVFRFVPCDDCGNWLPYQSLIY